jgi:catechol 2,3-dioxygenase-like lactoylglutathione lyase family enzyme
MTLSKITPVRIVDRIEPCLAFWCDALGYEKVDEVPHGGVLGFVILGGAGGPIMFQTRASLAEDLPSVAALEPELVLFVECTSLDAVKKTLRGVEVLVAERTTFYGTRETVVVDPQGGVIIFAEHQAATK